MRKTQSDGEIRYFVDFSFGAKPFPLIGDVLVIKNGERRRIKKIGQALEILAPDIFLEIEPAADKSARDAVFVKKGLLRKLPPEHLMAILDRHVLSRMVDEEVQNVDLTVKLHMEGLEQSFRPEPTGQPTENA